MINAKKELLDFVGDRKVIDASVAFFFDDDPWPYRFYYGEFYVSDSTTYDEFLNKLDFIYNNKEVSPALNLFGFLSFDDGTFACRTKYNQLERWDFD